MPSTHRYAVAHAATAEAVAAYLRTALALLESHEVPAADVLLLARVSLHILVDTAIETEAKRRNVVVASPTHQRLLYERRRRQQMVDGAVARVVPIRPADGRRSR